MKIRLNETNISILPMNELDDDSVRLSKRTRGGLEGVIGGMYVEEVYGRFERLGASRDRPYFLLEDEDDGWVSFRHFNQPGHPPRVDAHLRLWYRPLHTQEIVNIHFDDSQFAIFSEKSRPLLVELQKAATIVNARRAVGRPSKDVLEEKQNALTKIMMFKQLVSMLSLPEKSERYVEIVERHIDNLSPKHENVVTHMAGSRETMQTLRE